MTFKGWPVEAVEFYEGLEADNTKAYWQEHKAVYERGVKGPMEELLEELAGEFGRGRLFKPHRDLRFSKDKSPYKLNCAAHLPAGYVSFSAEGLFAGSGLYMPDPSQLQRFRSAVADDRSGPELVSVVAALRAGGYDVGASEVLKAPPKGYPNDHPRIDLLKHKGVVMSKSWPAGPWLGTSKAKDRVVRCLRAAGPLNAWLERYVSSSPLLKTPSRPHRPAPAGVQPTWQGRTPLTGQRYKWGSFPMALARRSAP
jgi:uncharacterized protein (TIGR02453 family)